MLRPGANRIKSLGGLHEFMNCSLPILTDSGGFQVMSLSKLNKIDREKGAIFQSHIDGKKYILNEEMVVIADNDQVQAIGGIMGGEGSSCTENTTNVFLEAALFNPSNIAKTGRKIERS